MSFLNKTSSLSLGIMFAMLAGQSSAVFANDQTFNRIFPLKRIENQTTNYQNFKRNPNEMVEIIVEFEQSSVVEVSNKNAREGKQRLTSAEQQDFAAIISDQHEQFKLKLTQLKSSNDNDLKIIGETRMALNAIHLFGKREHIDALRTMDNVKRVSIVQPVKLNLSSSVPWIGSPEAQAIIGGMGEGVSVGIIDTGIDYTHAGLGGSGKLEDFENNDPNIIEPGTFPTAKVVGGYDFAGSTYFPFCTGDSPDLDFQPPAPDPDPLDLHFHGSHVASTAAGIGVEGIIGPGVAPGANLYALKVFGDDTRCTTLTVHAIEWSMDPNGDGSTDDHLDIINMSLGSGFGGLTSPTAIAANNAAEAGVIVVASAGNAGDVPYITGAPGSAEHAISVANSIPGFRPPLPGVGMPIESTDEVINGQTFVGIEGSGLVRFTDFDPAIGGSFVAADSLLACEPLNNDINGGIALVSRGACTFFDKVTNAQNAGASAVIVFNDGASEDRIAPILMGGLNDESLTIPSAMISFHDGQAILAVLGADNSVNTTFTEVLIDADPALDNTINGGSSRGPGHGGSRFKPDIAAPGTNITAVSAGTGGSPLTISGTSMASPHVAGVAALLKQQDPSHNSKSVEAVLQNTSVTANIEGPGTNTPYPLTRQGVGVVDAENAVQATAYTYPAGLTFGRLEPFAGHTTLDYEWSKLYNKTASARTFQVTHVPNRELPGVSVWGPNSIDVAANSLTDFSIAVSFNPQLINEDPEYVDEGFFTQDEFDGWFILDDGVETLRVGYIGVIDPASDIVAQRMDRSSIKLTNNSWYAGIADGFTLAGFGGLFSDNRPHSIEGFGYRADDFVVEFALSTEKPWETFSALGIELSLDTNEDGVADYLVVVGDFGNITSGNYDGAVVAFLINLNDLEAPVPGFFANADYNDSVLTFPVLRNMVDDGFLAEGDTDFNYQLNVFSGSLGGFDTQSGRIDLDEQLLLGNQQSMLLKAGETATVTVDNDQGGLLWLYQTNTRYNQADVVNINN